jgi:hypothetical protein
MGRHISLLGDRPWGVTVNDKRYDVRKWFATIGILKLWHDVGQLGHPSVVLWARFQIGCVISKIFIIFSLYKKLYYEQPENEYATPSYGTAIPSQTH